MSDLRTAAQQALEALETGGWNMTARAIADLERALAQQAEPEGSVCARCGALAFDPVLPQQAEPVQDHVPDAGKMVQDQRCRAEPRSDGDFVCDCSECPGRSAEPAQQAEPAQDVLLSAAGLALDALEHDRQAAARSGRSISMLSSRAIEELRGAFRAARRVRQQDPGFWGSGDGYWIRAEDKAIRPDRERFTVAFYTAPPQQVAQQAEPLNLSDPAVQKRLATQWGYVPAAQAEPVEPVAWLAPDGSVRKTPAAKSFGEWVWGPDDFRPLYTAPPQRKPLTLEKIYHATGHCGVSKYTAVNITRAVERAHGIKE